MYSSVRICVLQSLRLLPAVLAIGISTIVGCSQVDKARQSMRRGEPVQAVQLYKQALADDPDDEDVQTELAQARRAAGDTLAGDARTALDAGRLANAVALATQAAQHDRNYRDLEQTARHARADALLKQSESARANQRFNIAREHATDARQVAPDLAEPVSRLALIDRSEAEDLRDRLETMLTAGNFTDAARLATRAAALQPGDQAFAQLPTVVEQRRREAAFDSLAVDAQRAIDDGRLGAFWPIHAKLAALHVRLDELGDLQQRFTDREQRLLETIDQAEAARAADNFERAVGLYAAAESIATDRPELAEQRIAIETLGQATALQNAGRAAIDDGAYDDAIDNLRQSLKLNAISDTDDLLREAERRWYRQAYQDALQHDNRAAAIDQLSKLLRVAPEAALTESLQQLRAELTDASLAEASSLHADGDTQTALHVLRRAMDRVHDQRLDALHGSLTAEQLLQRAVAADQAQQFNQSRELYLQALAAGGDRAAIESRIIDIRVLDDMQQRQRAAEQDAQQLGSALNTTRLQLQSREKENRSLLDQIRSCESEIDRLAYTLKRAEYEIRHEESRSRALASDVYNLKCEIDRLKDDLRHAQRHAQTSHSRRSDRDDRDSRRPRTE